jgi:hypothetical protein
VGSIVKQPASLSFVEGASIWMMFVTAYSALIEDAKVSKGDFVIIPAASSSVGYLTPCASSICSAALRFLSARMAVNARSPIVPRDIGVILTRSVAIFVQPKLSRNMSTCPDRGIAGQVDMLFATFKSGRGTKRRASAPFMENGSHSATIGDRAMDATDLIRTLWRRSAALQWRISSECATVGKRRKLT